MSLASRVATLYAEVHTQQDSLEEWFAYEEMAHDQAIGSASTTALADCTHSLSLASCQPLLP